QVCLTDGSAEQQDAGPPPVPNVATVRLCLAQGSRTTQCLDGMFREFLRDHSTMEALALLRSLEAMDTAILVSCHPVAHAIGRETFRVKGTIQDGFAACDLTCNSGCYHGVMERFLRSDAVDRCGGQTGHVQLGELEAKAATACDPSLPMLVRFQCLHG